MSSPAHHVNVVPPDEDEAGFTVDEALDYIGFGKFQVLMVVFAGTAWFADAMEIMLLSFLGPSARCEWDLQAWEEGLITSVVFMGMGVGSCIWGALSDWQGRRTAFLATSLVTTLAGLLSATAPTLKMLLAARCLVGVGLAGVPVAFTLLMEFLPSRGRGAWLSGVQSAWTLGTVCEALVAWAVLPAFGWRGLLAISALPMAPLAVAIVLLPESPHYLAARGRTLEALQVLHRIAAVNRRPLPAGHLHATPASPKSHPLPHPPPQLRPLRRGTPTPSPHHPPLLHTPSAPNPTPRRPPTPLARRLHTLATPLRRMFSAPLRRRSLLLLMVWFVAAFGYYGLVMLASQLQLHGTGPKENPCQAPPGGSGPPRAHFAWQGFRNVLVTSLAEIPSLLLAVVAVEQVGRRRATGWGFSLTGLCALPLLVTGWAGAGPRAGPGAVVQGMALFGSRLFVMGAFTVLYVYTPELYPTSIRNMGLGFCNAVSRLGGMLVPLVSVDMVRAGHAGVAAGLLAVVCLLAGGAVGCIDVETAGKGLEEVGGAEVAEGEGGARVGGQGRHGAGEEERGHLLRTSVDGVMQVAAGSPVASRGGPMF